jgi:hypothetical protein
MSDDKDKPLLKRPSFITPFFLAILAIPLLLAAYMELTGQAEEVVVAQAKIEAPVPEPRYRGREENPNPEPADNSCMPELMGLEPGADVYARIKESGKTYRVLKPGAMMTMDYSEHRVNLEVNRHGLISKVWCG